MSDEKKIIIDEDWKSQVVAEREELEREQSKSKPSDTSSASASGPLPKASFGVLITTFATEAMVALGQLPSPLTQKVVKDLDQARYAIDMLQVLQEKTQGNLSEGEEAALQDLLHQLRMAFVAAQTAPQE